MAGLVPAIYLSKERRGSGSRPPRRVTGPRGKGNGKNDRGGFRLYRRRRRHRRLHHGQSSVGQAGQSRPDPGGRRQRQLDLVPHPGRLSLRDRQSAFGLDVPDRARTGPQRPIARLSPRQGDRRLLGHQRHDLDARAGRRLRPLAPARPDRLGLGRRAAGVSRTGGSFPRRKRASRHRRRLADRGAAVVLGGAGRGRQGRGANGHPQNARLQHRRQ